jgi:hypothetical protein
LDTWFFLQDYSTYLLSICRSHLGAGFSLSLMGSRRKKSIGIIGGGIGGAAAAVALHQIGASESRCCDR